MTRPKADSDPWLTDPVSRDKVIANVVVKGIREIVLLLREIRDEMVTSNRALQEENRELRQQLGVAYSSGVPVTERAPRHDFNPCEKTPCTLPQGHLGAHRGSVEISVVSFKSNHG